MTNRYVAPLKYSVNLNSHLNFKFKGKTIVMAVPYLSPFVKCFSVTNTRQSQLFLLLTAPLLLPRLQNLDCQLASDKHSILSNRRRDKDYFIPLKTGCQRKDGREFHRVRLQRYVSGQVRLYDGSTRSRRQVPIFKNFYRRKLRPYDNLPMQLILLRS